MSGAHGHGHIEVEGNNKKIALLISVLALFLALVETMAKGAQTNALSYNIEASNLWAFFRPRPFARRSFALPARWLSLTRSATPSQRPPMPSRSGLTLGQKQ